MSRKVDLNLSAEDMIQIAEAIGDWDKLWEAIGYLSAWNLTYPTVGIFRGGKTDLVAAYFKDDKDDGNRGYVIGAVWHGARYGFHS